mmetsp:Transcript_39351/g.104463  ORF Transcript_39351/g.104463 Transcript_39351/m.104463 type:complete len:225 (+) Transcript_39351:2957-3631(+)
MDALTVMEAVAPMVIETVAPGELLLMASLQMSAHSSELIKPLLSPSILRNAARASASPAPCAIAHLRNAFCPMTRCPLPPASSTVCNPSPLLCLLSDITLPSPSGSAAPSLPRLPPFVLGTELRDPPVAPTAAPVVITLSPSPSPAVRISSNSLWIQSPGLPDLNALKAAFRIASSKKSFPVDLVAVELPDQPPRPLFRTCTTRAPHFLKNGYFHPQQQIAEKE